MLNAFNASLIQLLFKLIDAETRRLSVEDEFKRFKTAMSAQLHSNAEAYATSQAQLQAQIQQVQARVRTDSQSQGAGPATSTVSFPTTTPSQRDSSYDISYQPQNNPLPRPPEPIPLSMLPDFARPASRSFREDERRERRKEKERHRERNRERDGDKEGERDRDREKRRRHREGVKERGAVTDREASATEAQGRRTRKIRQSFTEGVPPPDIPHDVVGGWGLERNWRASLNGSNADLSQTLMSDVGSRHATVRTKEKGKTRERERDRGEYANLESASEQEGEEYVFVELSAQEERKERERERERRHRDKERSSLGLGHASSSRPRGKERDRERGAESGRETRDRERKRDTKDKESRRASHTIDPAMHPQVVPVPVPVPISFSSSYLPNTSNASAHSALGLILVPSPDGKGYEYRYAPIQGSMDSGRTVVLAQNHVDAHGQPIAVAPSFATSTYSTNYSNSSSDGAVRAPTSTDFHSYALTQATTGHRSPHPVRRVTDPVVPGQVYDTSLHVPQPRRISTHIPEVDPSPEPSSGNTSGASTVVPTSQPNLSLDAAIAQLQLSQPQPPIMQQVAESSAVRMEPTPSQQELKHKTSATSTISNTSTSISLTGSTSGERRKQLLDALFPSTGTTPGAGPQMPSARGLPSVDGRPSRGLSSSTRPQSAMPAAPQPSQTNGHARQATYPPPTFASANPYSSYYQQPHAASSTSLTSTFVDTREPTYPGGYATVEAAQAWSTSGVGEARQRTKTDNSN